MICRFCEATRKNIKDLVGYPAKLMYRHLPPPLPRKAPNKPVPRWMKLPRDYLKERDRP